MSDLQRYIAQRSADSPEFARLRARAEQTLPSFELIRTLLAVEYWSQVALGALGIYITGYIVVALVKLLM